MNNDELQRLYDGGLSTYQLAEKFGCSSETIRKRLKKVRSISENNRLRNSDILKQISKSCKKKWQEDNYRQRVMAGRQREGYLEDISKNTKIKLAEPDVRKKIIDLAKKNSKQTSMRVKKYWEDEAYREKQQIYFGIRAAKASQKSVDILKNPIRRKQWIEKLRKISTDRIEASGYISTAQKQLYFVLQYSNIKYYEEGEQTRISPFYVVDCVILKQQRMFRDLIIEVQGEYWHQLEHVVLKDRQKRTYIERHTNYDLLCLTELEVRNWISLQAKFNTYGLSLLTITCTIKNVILHKIKEDQTELFYSIFHYASRPRKGAKTYGVFLNDNLVAAISYSYPIRQEVSGSLGLEYRQVMEISRMARMTNLYCPNLLSWLISKTIQKLPTDIKAVISYSDATYKHTGAVYKASNFRCDKEINPDYFYLNIDGARYHKKTIWDRSKKMKMLESDYAKKHSLQKIYSKSKKRWVLYR